MRPNLPVMITGLTDGWRATREWVSETSDGSRVVDMRAMSEAFGAAEVLVVNCDDALDTDLARRQMRFRLYADWWRARRSSPRETRRHRADDPSTKAKLYVKDWSMASDFPDYRAYVTPPHVRRRLAQRVLGRTRAVRRGVVRASPTKDFEDAPTENEKDGGGTHRFVYCGVEGTWTPLHADVLRSFSWSVNIVGRKRWLMIPPQRSVHLLARDGSGRRSRTSAPPAPPTRSTRKIPFPGARRSRPIASINPPAPPSSCPRCGTTRSITSQTVSASITTGSTRRRGASAAYLRDELADVQEGLPDPEDRADGVLCQRLVARRAGADCATFAGIVASAVRIVARGKRRRTIDRSSRANRESEGDTW